MRIKFKKFPTILKIYWNDILKKIASRMVVISINNKEIKEFKWKIVKKKRKLKMCQMQK